MPTAADYIRSGFQELADKIYEAHQWEYRQKQEQAQWELRLRMQAEQDRIERERAEKFAEEQRKLAEARSVRLRTLDAKLKEDDDNYYGNADLRYTMTHNWTPEELAASPLTPMGVPLPVIQQVTARNLKDTLDQRKTLTPEQIEGLQFFDPTTRSDFLKAHAQNEDYRFQVQRQLQDMASQTATGRRQEAAEVRADARALAIENRAEASNIKSTLINMGAELKSRTSQIGMIDRQILGRKDKLQKMTEDKTYNQLLTLMAKNPNDRALANWRSYFDAKSAGIDELKSQIAELEDTKEFAVKERLAIKEGGRILKAHGYKAYMDYLFADTNEKPEEPNPASESGGAPATPPGGPAGAGTQMSVAPPSPEKEFAKIRQLVAAGMTESDAKTALSIAPDTPVEQIIQFWQKHQSMLKQ